MNTYKEESTSVFPEGKEPCSYSMEEARMMIRRGMEEVEQGQYFTTEQMFNRVNEMIGRCK